MPEPPAVDVPSYGRHIWEWYWAISGTLRRVDRAGTLPITPTEFVAWTKAARVIVHPSEYAILCAMDAAWCSEMGAEVADYRERERERYAAESKRGKKG